MTALLARHGIAPAAALREDPLPAPLGRGSNVTSVLAARGVAAPRPAHAPQPGAALRRRVLPLPRERRQTHEAKVKDKLGWSTFRVSRWSTFGLTNTNPDDGVTILAAPLVGLLDMAGLTNRQVRVLQPLRRLLLLIGFGDGVLRILEDAELNRSCRCNRPLLEKGAQLTLLEVLHRPVVVVFRDDEQLIVLGDLNEPRGRPEALTTLLTASRLSTLRTASRLSLRMRRLRLVVSALLRSTRSSA